MHCTTHTGVREECAHLRRGAQSLDAKKHALEGARGARTQPPAPLTAPNSFVRHCRATRSRYLQLCAWLSTRIICEVLVTLWPP